MQCKLCPVRCGADRPNAAGRCGVKGLTVAKAYLHPYEEPPICHTNGAGAVFFGGCSLRCAFCQNYELSRAQRGREVTPKELSEIFLSLEEAGADIIDLVTPDHVSDLIAEALALRRPSVPVVYNSSGYATVDALRRIDPFIDVYLPDLKFCDPTLSNRYTGRSDYFEVAKKAISFMAQKPLKRREGGALESGILVRHLVLPGATGDSLKILDFLAHALPQTSPLSIMRQYTPMGDIESFPELRRRVTSREYRRVVDYAFALGFSEIYTQSKESASARYIPDWDG